MSVPGMGRKIERIGITPSWHNFSIPEINEDVDSRPTIIRLLTFPVFPQYVVAFFKASKY